MAMDGDVKCGVCRVNRALGVASTIIPFSCAYCVECARRHAQPLMVFEYFYDDLGTDFDKMGEMADKLETYAGGNYINYRTWAAKRQAGECAT